MTNLDALPLNSPATTIEDLDEGLAYANAKPADVADLDMTPMVDVAMQLILFFMVTAGMILQSCLEFPKPDAYTGGGRSFDDRKITVNVKADNTVWVNDVLTEAPVLAERLSTIKRKELILGGVVVAADENAFHGTVVAVVDAANVAELEPIRVAKFKKSTASPARKRPVAD